MKTLLSSLAVFLVLTSLPRALAAGDDEVFAALQKATSDLDKVKIPEKIVLDVPLSSLWRKMNQHTDILRSASEGKRLPEAYKASLQYSTEALKRVVQKNSLPSSLKVAICQSVESDLAIKATFAQQHSSIPFHDMQVIVETLRGTQKVPGCEVWFVPTAWQDTPQKFQRFQQLSSPTNQALPPGYYVMWTAEAGNLGAKTPVTVNDPAAEKVDLPAP